MLVLVIADLYIPLRAKGMPEELGKLLQKDTYDLVVSTGNLCDKSVHSFMKSLGKTKVIEGGHDDVKDLPEMEEVMAGELKIGITRETDFESLLAAQRKLACDIVVHKSSSHTCTAISKKGRLYICPGSGTGAFSLSHRDVIPSFLVLEITGTDVAVFQYSYVNETLEVTGKNFTIASPMGAAEEE
eukprot:TRINITY_DN13387_c1_g1_i1.p1 TRINITY_DN13387_c1_g1~~TRINITY_DN13387_c1_g1_i1.p1  ORF type:complete len:186 (+),score=32.86 TRINITY_DN13387_c1_g1_i1:117-674(+)